MYTVEIQEVGEKFGCIAIIRKNGSEVVYQTRVYPYGFDGTARREALEEAALRGMVIDDGDDP